MDKELYIPVGIVGIILNIGACILHILNGSYIWFTTNFICLLYIVTQFIINSNKKEK